MFSAIQSITRSVLFPGCTGNNKKDESYTATHFSKLLSDWERSALPGEERCHAAAVIRDCLAGKKTELNLSGLNLCSLPDGLADVIKNTVTSIDISDNNIRSPALLTEFLSLKDSAELIYHNNPACCFAGNNYELKVLSKKTPVAFQWHVMNKNMESEKYPVINTNQYPYLDNILNTCKTESGRIIGLLISGDVSEKHKASLSELQTQYSNLKIIYAEQLDRSDFFRIKAIDCIKKTIAAGKSNNIHQEDMDMLYSELDDVCSSEPDITLFDEFSESGGHSEMDFYRNLLLFNGGGVFLSPNDDNHGALIYLDCDMIINKPLGEIVLVDGIGIYNKSGVMENGIIAVDRARHPVLEAGMDIMENDRFKAHPYYDGICGGLRQHFSYNQRIHGKGKLAEFIAFPVDNMSPDTSTRTGSSSW
ncbi:hypothetical protein TUM12151_06050 [Morganella morganii]|uniref:hypothetical protein n=1 Tax=Morganella morganii TaxID=582 RepID=UPI001C7D156C|nr:hypothetical protein [Morganella morganii]GIZ27007.1 hypothetical protein TUM12149_09770 [Morganella morganii]GIZ30944.1 hypothetical protein TUM12150_14300 [Morganella morganii]GIZ33619.1 hypothetical protein TUM12151_06050 [Morganella morganii]